MFVRPVVLEELPQTDGNTLYSVNVNNAKLCKIDSKCYKIFTANQIAQPTYLRFAGFDVLKVDFSN